MSGCKRAVLQRTDVPDYLAALGSDERDIPDVVPDVVCGEEVGQAVALYQVAACCGVYLMTWVGCVLRVCVILVCGLVDCGRCFMT